MRRFACGPLSTERTTAIRPGPEHFGVCANQWLPENFVGCVAPIHLAPAAVPIIRLRRIPDLRSGLSRSSSAPQRPGPRRGGGRGVVDDPSTSSALQHSMIVVANAVEARKVRVHGRWTAADLW